MATKNHELPDKVKQYMTRITQGLPGGVACRACHIVNTYYHVTLKWKFLGDNKYEIRQLVACENCDHDHWYGWVQDFSQKPSVTSKIEVKK